MNNFAEQFQKYSYLVIQKLDGFIKHGLYQAGDILKVQTKAVAAQLNSHLGTSSGKHGYTVPLNEGVIRALHTDNVPNFVRVNILGPRHNDGTWRLRFFEGGTKINGKQRIRPLNFFEQSINSSQPSIQNSIKQSLDELANKVNQIEV